MNVAPQALLAQLVEHRSYEPKVMGSSPIWSTFYFYLFIFTLLYATPNNL